MTNAELAQLIRDQFTPFAMSCPCKGEHSDCNEAMQNEYLWAQYDTVVRIANYIQKL
jgi:hypothetical protein